MRYKLRKEYTKNPDKALMEILLDRGVKDLAAFLDPTFTCELNPYDLENITIAAEALLAHLRNKDNIVFVVDQDMDGFASSAILWLYIKAIFPDANLFFTIHEHKQHGLDDKVNWIIDQEKFNLVLAPDAASFDIECHKQLHAAGIDVICLDHHMPPQDKNGNDIYPQPEYAIVVNNQISNKYMNKTLCGSGVVYKFCEVLDDILGISQAHNFIDLAALGEIADVMDRTNTETNYIMMKGLRNIRNKGFQTLIEAQSFSLKDKAHAPYVGLTPIDIAFYIAPLINAITRVGTITEKETMFYCFIEPDKIVPSTKRGAKEGDTETAAEQTARVGKNAKAKQDRIKEKAVDLIDFKIQKDDLDSNNIIIVELNDSDGIPQEMTGLIAMSIVSKYHKPVMLGRRNSSNEVQGSIRSDGNFAGLPSFKQFLENSKLISYAAGHDNACGFGINGKKIEQLLHYANTQLNASDFENCYIVDYILNAAANNSSLLFSLASHPEYFGNHIEEPTIVIKNISLQSIMVMGTSKDSIKISYNDVDYIKFKDENFIEEILQNRMKKLTVYGKVNINNFNGHTSVQVFINDYELENDEHKYDF